MNHPHLIIDKTSKSARKRKKPSDFAQERILETQDGRCFYCGLKLNEWYHDGKFARCRELHWDHVFPYSIGLNNNVDNFVAACSQCNLIKSDKVFDTLDDAANYVRNKRAKKKLPVHPLWGNSRTQKVMAAVLFGDVSKQALLEVPQDSDSVEELERKLENIKVAQKLLRKF